MLDATAGALRQGGTLLYSVCTVTTEETAYVIKEFLQHHPEFAFIPMDPREVPSEEFIDSFGFLNTFPQVRIRLQTAFSRRAF